MASASNDEQEQIFLGKKGKTAQGQKNVDRRNQKDDRKKDVIYDLK